MNGYYMVPDIIYILLEAQQNFTTYSQII